MPESLFARLVNKILNHANGGNRMKSILNFLDQDHRLLVSEFNFRDHANDTCFACSEVKLGVATTRFRFPGEKPLHLPHLTPLMR